MILIVGLHLIFGSQMLDNQEILFIGQAGLGMAKIGSGSESGLPGSGPGH